MISAASVVARHQVGAAENGRLALGEDETVDASEVRAVYTRLLYLDETELPQIVASDRAYVASEMTAFLLAWLSESMVAVLNATLRSQLGIQASGIRKERLHSSRR